MMKKRQRRTKLFSAIVFMLLAVVPLSATVFASEGLTENAEQTIMILNSGKELLFTNKPFVKEDTVYIPLREFMQSLGMDDTTGIVWNDGVINLYLEGHIDYYTIEINKKSIQYESVEHLPNSLAIRECCNSPLLINDLTYIPYEYINFIFNRFDDNYFIDYEIYDKDNNKVDFSKISSLLFDEKFSMEIPTLWNGKVERIASDDADQIQFVQSAAYTKYGVGVLFSIKKVEASAADELLQMLGGSRLLYKDSECAYLFMVPTDVQMPIWDGSDEEDIGIAAEYRKLYADVEKIAESIKTVNAEAFSLADMQALQNEVDNGHYPWRLNPNDVITEFVNAKGISGGEIQNLFEGETVSADYKYGEDVYKIELYQPTKVNQNGIWVVKSFEKVQ